MTYHIYFKTRLFMSNLDIIINANICELITICNRLQLLIYYHSTYMIHIKNDSRDKISHASKTYYKQRSAL
jgi:hypothetical protein